ncbi:unnamed protein product [Amaranthus hypochondriacus]
MKQNQIEKSKTIPIIWDCGSPLYDSHELASLSLIIERHMRALPSSSLSSSSSSNRSLSLSSSSSFDRLRSEDSSLEANDDVGKLSDIIKGREWKRKVLDWDEMSKKKANKRIKVSGCFNLNYKLWKK